MILHRLTTRPARETQRARNLTSNMGSNGLSDAQNSNSLNSHVSDKYPLLLGGPSTVSVLFRRLPLLTFFFVFSFALTLIPARSPVTLKLFVCN